MPLDGDSTPCRESLGALLPGTGATMSSLTERYRPKSWGEVVGQEKIVSRIHALAKRGLAGRAFWISGQSGTGKSSIARLLAAEVADDFVIREIDAGTQTSDARFPGPGLT